MMVVEEERRKVKTTSGLSIGRRKAIQGCSRTWRKPVNTTSVRLVLVTHRQRWRSFFLLFFLRD